MREITATVSCSICGDTIELDLGENMFALEGVIDEMLERYGWDVLIDDTCPDCKEDKGE